MSNITIGNLTVFQTDKKTRREFSEGLVNSLEEGQLNPLDVNLWLKHMERFISTLTVSDTKKNKDADLAIRFKKITLEEAAKHGKKFEYHNAEISEREVGVRYDYSVCNDNVLNELQKELDALKEKIKQREDFLKSIPDEGLEVLVEDTIETLYKPNKTSTTSLTFTIK